MINGITKLEFNSDGFKQILEGEGVKNLVESSANKIKSEADGNVSGDSTGFKVNTHIGGYGGGRYISHVNSTDLESAKAESEGKALTKAVHP